MPQTSVKDIGEEYAQSQKPISKTIFFGYKDIIKV